MVRQAQAEQDAAARRAETVRLLSQAESAADTLRHASAGLRFGVEATGRRVKPAVMRLPLPAANTARCGSLRSAKHHPGFRMR